MKQTIAFPDGREVLNLGQGTYRMGEEFKKKQQEIEALRTGIENGLTLIDTAEMYSEGRSEEIVGEAIQPYKRDDLFIVSKVLPMNAGEQHIHQSIDGTLKRLGVDELDLYLLHWRGHIPLQETVDVMEELKWRGKIKGWGVSNFDLEDIQELLSLRNGLNCQTNQLLYHLASRGIEFVLTDYLKESRIPIMAYCPIIGQEPDKKEMVHQSPTINRMARKYNLSVVQLLLAFVTQQENMIAIPKAASRDHVLQNADVLQVELDDEDILILNEAFPVPDKRVPLKTK